jgi:tRNA-splicing ligase RtcB (3'-phosphate/5'-hydroxy nucleic acid ligase)
METIVERKFRVPTKSWLPRHEIDSAAMAQLRLAACHSMVSPHIAVMPDCHPGDRVTIGCVLPTERAVIPAAVGSDIGCGMTAMDTGLDYDPHEMNARFWLNWASEVRSAVPVGSTSHDEDIPDWQGFDEEFADSIIARLVLDQAPKSLGTLGGGNHFMEAQVDERNRIWLIVHSGSRIAGLVINDYYERVARQGNDHNRDDTPGQLWWLRTDKDAGRAYLHDMEWATRFASENRRRMLLHMLEGLGTTLDGARGSEAILNCQHNFARIESHEGRELVVHRKGATSAAIDERALIPGSMGTASYVVSGLGQPDSFRSCSHGAGRLLSRSAAREQLDIEDLEIALFLAGTHTPALNGLVNEAPQAYKSIDSVIL